MSDDVQVIRVDDADDSPTVVYVPGPGGVSEGELDAALTPYATKVYVNAAIDGVVVSGGGGPRSYHHEQPVPADTWTVPHDLGFNPGGVVARDATGLIEPADITYPDIDTCVLSWSVATAGSADLS